MRGSIVVCRRHYTLIERWDHMCNIVYEYKKEDPFEVALQNVLRTLCKEMGITIYNFLVKGEGASGEVDVALLEHARAHKQCDTFNERAF